MLTRGGGYVLDIEPDQLDAERFERLARRRARALERGEAPARSELLREALDLWRGPPLARPRVRAVRPEPRSRASRSSGWSTLEQRIEADLALGRHAALIPELETLVREHPARERLRAQLILALYRSGRQADALASYRDARRALVDELGLEPSRELQDSSERSSLRTPRSTRPRGARPALAGLAARPRRSAASRVGGGLLLAAALAAIFAGG